MGFEDEFTKGDAEKWLEEVKENLNDIQDEKGTDSHLEYAVCDFETRAKVTMEYIRELCLKEGISFACILPTKKALGTFIFTKKPFTSQNSILDLLGDLDKGALDEWDYSYIKKEQEYSKRIANGESFLDLQAEIPTEELNYSEECERIITRDALVNAAYRNGLEGDICGFENYAFDKIQPTFTQYFVGLEDWQRQNIDNYMTLSHSRNKAIGTKIKEKTTV